MVNGVAQGYPWAPACVPLTQTGGRRGVTLVRSAHRLELRQHAGENLQSQVLFVVQSVCSTLDDADLVVQSFHESEGDLVLWPTIGGDSVPMPIDHLGKQATFDA